ncbi:hypothetical protein GCM10011386_18630 [Parapedobacter defluvii]|uniref:DUF2911 domain-containing protein n=1 Tax=Parapedobacter defluvii TaxID=2045106 RepID=A0ABQ1LPD5_9SPHI|nr:DUF2911 domain-containing protein [Parapedobacter defluvii]RQP09684.1 MAG: DUF2911 domain-containing protein [Parapedobacter sp.]GGC26814.1 hypothetical protein GCM10011386_18630 [Parapedobacter defluvii]
MKATVLSFVFVMALSVLSFAQQDKSKRASPPAHTTVTTADGVTIDIHYSQPSLKGRKIGVDIAPFGKVWRTGANEATTFEVNKDVLVQGQALPAGKYSLYSIPTEQNTTIIFNKVWDQWGTQYDESQDALRVVVMGNESGQSVEQFTIKADKNGTVTLVWGPYSVPFTVKAAN